MMFCNVSKIDDLFLLYRCKAFYVLLVDNAINFSKKTQIFLDEKEKFCDTAFVERAVGLSIFFGVFDI